MEQAVVSRYKVLLDCLILYLPLFTPLYGCACLLNTFFFLCAQSFKLCDRMAIKFSLGIELFPLIVQENEEEQEKIPYQKLVA